ncbi:TDRD1_4_6_7 [Lepeophtheirus salmonis]|uniref:TDRD1_4_6_7 n=1 Tax=Lepeophtheirus salmonis TaxID=72036 RepID=A0A7R8D4H4_LEPSM|nr:TDRD1_4_6_7 [Lepeophtheirus salmonis]CAF3025542.1 TDRD1_4_6_7 [Lepeophtheirus salmonis]
MKEERMSVRDIKEGEFQWICFCDGIPWDFYVRKTSDSESVRLIESQMRQSLVNLLEDEPCIGYIYGVKWDQDSQYYRGEILEKLNEDLYMIRLIDYGNVEDLEEFRGTLCAPSVRENFHTWLGVGLPIEAQFFPQNGFYSVCLRIQLLSSLFCSVLAHETSPRVVSEKENCLHDNSKQQESEYSSFEELMSRSNKAQETGSISGSQSSDSFSNPPSLNNQTKSIEELSKAMSKTLAISNETQNPTKEPERGQEYPPIQSTIPKLMDCYNYSENTELIRGSKINIYYTGGPGPEKFYSIFFNDHSIQYPEFYEEIQDYYNNSDEYEELYLVDYSPVAVYEYESWNRALRKLNREFLKYPPLIKACKLYHPHGLSPQTFSKEGLEVFVNLFNEKTESVYIELEDANLHPRDRVYLISPLSENGIPFQCILKERGFGYFEFQKKDYEEQNNTLAYRSDNIDCVLDQKYTIGPNGKEADPIYDPKAFAGQDVTYDQLEELELPQIDSLVVAQSPSFNHTGNIQNI